MNRLGVRAAALVFSLLALGLTVPGRAALTPTATPAGADLPSMFEAAPTSPDCLEPWPDVAATATIPSDNGRTVDLDVRVLLDGVALARGQQIMSRVAWTFGPLKVNVRPSYESVAFSGTTAEHKIAQAKSRYGGLRPGGIDVVHVLTATNLVDAAGSPVPAGEVDCIGGIKNPGMGFSVAESYGTENFRVGPLTLYYEAESKISAHEIAHVLGAQHHLSNCAEGIPSELNVPEVSPCTLMFPTVEAASFNLSAANAVIVRAYAYKYA